MRQAAPTIKFRVDGKVQRRFMTAGLQQETWNPTLDALRGDVTIVGRLYAVNLHTHRLLVQDDVGHQFALPNVADDADIGPLLGRHVVVTGLPEFDARGQLKRIRESAISAAPDPFGSPTVAESVALEEILAGAPGIKPGGIDGLSEVEADAFFDAMGL